MRELFNRKSIVALMTAVTIASSNLISPSPLIADGNNYDENGNCCDTGSSCCSIGDIALIGGAILIGAGVGAAVASSQKGKHGKKGHDGDSGSSGFSGPVGGTGPSGGTGPQGPAGFTGPNGPEGPTGPTGIAGTFPTTDIGPDRLEFRFETNITFDGNQFSATAPYVIGFVVAPNQQVFTTNPLNLSHQTETFVFFPGSGQFEPYIGLYDLGFVVGDITVPEGGEVPQSLGTIVVNFFQYNFETGQFAVSADNDVFTAPVRLWQRNEQYTVQYSYSPEQSTIPVIPVHTP